MGKTTCETFAARPIHRPATDIVRECDLRSTKDEDVVWRPCFLGCRSQTPEQSPFRDSMGGRLSRVLQIETYDLPDLNAYSV